MMKRICDPPEGWRYGFPKVMPKEQMTDEELFEWLVSEGYPPEKLPDGYTDFFPCRFWEQKE